MKLPVSSSASVVVEDENVSVVVLITVLTSFLQSYLDKIRKEEIRRHRRRVYACDKQIGRFFKTIGKK
jgi:hypothetical protein